MALEENATGGSVSSLLIGSSLSNRIENDLSPDDLAWVDSCLINDPDDSDSNWNSLREALSEIINNQPESLVSSLTGTSLSPEEGDDMDLLPSNGKAETKEFLKLTNEDLIVPTYEEAETMNNSFSIEEEGDILSLLAFEGDPSKNSLQDSILSNHEDGSQIINESRDSFHSSSFSSETERVVDGNVINEEAEILPSKAFKENLAETSLQDTVTSSSSLANINYSKDDIELSSRDIFRVWDLQIPSDEGEEDEFEQQLKKALNGSSRQTVSPSSGDSLGLEDVSIDDLIAGISDLSLNQAFS